MSIRLKKNKEKAVLNFHPWIFSGAIQAEPKDANPGETLRVLSFSGHFLAYGHFQPDSQIRLRLISFDENESDSHYGFWTNRWERIYNQKILRLADTKTDGFRFLYSEGDFSPGFIVDCYAKVAVIQFKTAGSRKHKQELIDFLIAKGFDSIVEKGEKADSVEGLPIEWNKGNATKAFFFENGFQFVADLVAGQKTGFFLDQRENRTLLGSYAKGRTILNAFGYSGAFSVYAIKNEAKLVHTLDISKSALALCEENLNLNFTSEQLENKHKNLLLDSFQYLNQMEKDFYDLIILDPPAFTKHKSTVNQAARGYKDINLKAMSKVKAGGTIFTFSCSQHISTDLFRKIIYGAAKDSGRQMKILHQMSQSWDHGFSIYHPEGEYLKGFVIQVD